MNELFKIASAENIEVMYANIPNCISLSMEGHICMDYSLLWGDAEERVHLAHELGHCETGSFYNRWSPYDIRQKHENHADRWAILRLVPSEDLKQAVENGITELWELADYFQVTEPFMQKAVEYYKMLEAT